MSTTLHTKQFRCARILVARSFAARNRIGYFASKKPRGTMRSFRLLIAATLTLVALAPLSSARGAEPIKFALPGNSMGYLPLFVAVHRGFFKDEGLDIELPRLIPTMAQNALLAGEVQYHGLADSGLRL